MKKTLSIGGILLVVGMVMAAVGFFSHRQPFHPISEPGQIQAKQTTLTTKHFNRVKVTAASASVSLKQGDKFAVKYYGTRHPAIKTTVKDGQLTITQTHITQTKHVHFFESDDRIVITVPKNTNLDKVAISVNDDLKIESVNLARADINDNDGDIVINNSKVKGGHLTNDDGDIDIANSKLDATRINSADGDINLSRVTVNGGKASLSSGDFTANKLTVLGQYRVNNQDGDIDVKTSNHPGAILTNEDGDNELGHQENDDGGTLQRDVDNHNLIHLTNNSGDNSLK